MGEIILKFSISMREEGERWLKNSLLVVRTKVITTNRLISVDCSSFGDSLWYFGYAFDLQGSAPKNQQRFVKGGYPGVYFAYHFNIFDSTCMFIL